MDVRYRDDAGVGLGIHRGAYPGHGRTSLSHARPIADVIQHRLRFTGHWHEMLHAIVLNFQEK